MARIKVFQGGGPNPNVPYAGDVPRPQYIGQVEQAVGGVFNEVEKGALQYMELQRKQKDVASVAQLDAAKMLYQSELDGREDIRGADGNIDVNKYRDELNKFYDTAKVNMSKDAYSQWSSTNTVQDARKMSTIMAENLKQTRLATKATTDMSIDFMLSNSITGTFEDMQDAAIKGKQAIESAVGAGTYTLSEGIEREDKLLKKTAKSYIDTVTTKVSDNPSEINDQFDKAVDFIKFDPLGIYKDTGLRDATLADVANKRLARVYESQNKQIQNITRQDSLEKKQQMQNYNSFNKELSAYWSQENPDPRELEGILSRIRESSDVGGLSASQAHDLANKRQRTLQLQDEMYVEMALAEEDIDRSMGWIDRISNQNTQANAFQSLTNVPLEARSGLKEAVKYNKAKSNEIMRKYTDLLPVFEELSEKYPDSGYEMEDFQYLFADEYMDKMSDAYFKAYTQYTTRVDTKLRMMGSGQKVEDRLKELSKRLNFNRIRQQGQ